MTSGNFQFECFVVVVGLYLTSVPGRTGSRQATQSMHAIHWGFLKMKRVVEWVCYVGDIICDVPLITV